MKKIKLISIFIFLFLSTKKLKSQKVLGTGANTDVIMALQPIQMHLKKILMQKSMDFKVYQNMERSQKALAKVYEVKEVISNMKSAYEIFELIEAYSCILKRLDDAIASPKIKIPLRIVNNIGNASCLFEYEYQQVLTGVSMCLDYVDIILSDVQMSLEDRLEILDIVHKKMYQLTIMTEKLSRELIFG